MWAGVSVFVHEGERKSKRKKESKTEHTAREYAKLECIFYRLSLNRKESLDAVGCKSCH